PRSPDQCPGPTGPLRAPPDPAPTQAMALGTSLGHPARRDPPTTRRLNRTSARQEPRPESHHGKAGQTGGLRPSRCNHPQKEDPQSVANDHGNRSVDPGSETALVPSLND